MDIPLAVADPAIFNYIASEYIDWRFCALKKFVNRGFWGSEILNGLAGKWLKCIKKKKWGPHQKESRHYFFFPIFLVRQLSLSLLFFVFILLFCRFPEISSGVWPPDRPFRNFWASKSVGRRPWTTNIKFADRRISRLYNCKRAGRAAEWLWSRRDV